MAGFIFENMTQAQASAFTSADALFFSDTTAPSSVTAAYAPQDGLTVPTITLSNGSHTLVFDAGSVSTPGQITFNADNSHVLVNFTGGTITVGATDSVVFGLDDSSQTTPLAYAIAVGNDADHAIHSGSGDDIINATGLHLGAAGGDGNDYVWGGAGKDEISLGDGNSHVYGGTNTAGAADGNDTITVGDGNNYINGNAGNDTIAVGTGSNRVQGGADADTITVAAGAGSNSINGNKGADTVDAHLSTGNNTLHGGQDNDTILSGAGHDTVFGDLGNDTLTVSGIANHVTVLTGGDGADTFDFHNVGAGAAVDISATGVATAGTYGAHTYYQEITDFTAGTDHIDLAVAGTSANFAVLQSPYANVLEAFNAATNDFATSAHTADVAQVGGDTYLFYKEGAATGAIKLDHVTASTIDFHSIV